MTKKKLIYCILWGYPKSSWYSPEETLGVLTPRKRYIIYHLGDLPTDGHLVVLPHFFVVAPLFCPDFFWKTYMKPRFITEICGSGVLIEG